jgi:hypothetical protein
MTQRTAKCACGALSAACEGEPARVSICHCLDCQRRSGSAFAYTATFAAEQVAPSGDFKSFTRTGDSGRWATFHFCPGCGTTVFYEIEVRPGMVSVPVGGFADSNFPEPKVSVYGERKHAWIGLNTSAPIGGE